MTPAEALADYLALVETARSELDAFDAVWAVHLADVRERIGEARESEEHPEEAFDERDEAWSSVRGWAGMLRSNVESFDEYGRQNLEREIRTLGSSARHAAWNREGLMRMYENRLTDGDAGAAQRLKEMREEQPPAREDEEAKIVRDAERGRDRLASDLEHFRRSARASGLEELTSIGEA